MLKRFYKEQDGKWYIDLPEWTGSKADLQMVCGADTMLDIIAEDDDEVHLSLSTEESEGSDVLNFMHLATDWENGAFYHMPTYKGFVFNLKIWLCDVTLFVFGEFPKNIYIKKINKLSSI
jgi:hypothetical protein